MRFKVPQNIDLEDKVIGPLTLRQFIYLLIGGMADYIVYKAIPGFTSYLLIMVFSIAAFAFAFIKIQEQDFAYFINAFFSFLVSPKIFVWNKEVHVEEIPKPAKPEHEEESGDKLTQDPQKVRSRLQMLAEVVDTQGWGKEKIGTRVASTDEPDQSTGGNIIEEKKHGIDDPLKEVEPEKAN